MRELSGSLVALVTPMAPDGSLDLEALSVLVDWHVESGTAALVVAGTTGESPTLSQQEHTQLLERAVRVAAGRIPIWAGAGTNDTASSIALSRSAVAAGVAGVMLVVPYYNKPTQEGLFQHFQAVAAAVSETPVLLYNVPGRTITDLLPETVQRLSAISNIVGIKEATGDLERARRIRELCGEDFLLFSGDDPTGCEFILEGGDGVISVTANIVPEAMAKMCASALAGDAAGARALGARLQPLHETLFIEPNPSPAKWALQRMGWIGSGIRLPLVPLSEAGRRALDQAMEEVGVPSRVSD
jgi:4-hydroxy-tetrahydrodipicolinate synthase